MFSSRSVQIAALFSDVSGKALPNLCRSFYNETKAEIFFSVFAVALLAEGVDRNLTAKEGQKNDLSSPSSRRAWIEISRSARAAQSSCVALLAEGVDRNSSNNVIFTPHLMSPSSRRAWIEMFDNVVGVAVIYSVALLAEGVDRNNYATYSQSLARMSPSSRRAWIEISWPRPPTPTASSPSSRRAWIEIVGRR